MESVWILIGVLIVFGFLWYAANILMTYFFVRSIENDEGKVVDDECRPVPEDCLIKDASW